MSVDTPSNTAEADELCALIEHIATRLVDDPSSIRVEADQQGPVIRVSLTIAEDEMGKVIGRGGSVARSMRTLLMVAASRRGLRSSLDIGN
jgi:hypothetical protein